VGGVRGNMVVARLGEDVVLVSLPRDLDAESIPAAARALLAARPHGGGYVIVDLAAVARLDPATLTLLVRWAGELTSDGGEVVVVSDDPRVRRHFALTGLDRMVRLEQTLMQAVDELVLAPFREPA
jgi:anti-sigma B factor antagonist